MGDGVMQAGGGARERLCLFITAAWRSSAPRTRSHARPRANVGLSLLPPPPPPLPRSSQAAPADAHVRVPHARSHTAHAACRSRPCTKSKQRSKKNNLCDALGSGNQAKNCRFAMPVCHQRVNPLPSIQPHSLRVLLKSHSGFKRHLFLDHLASRSLHPSRRRGLTCQDRPMPRCLCPSRTHFGELLSRTRVLEGDKGSGATPGGRGGW